MTKTEIIQLIREQSTLNKKDIARIVDKFILVIKKSIQNNECVELRRFGTFKTKSRIPYFKAAKRLKSLV